MINLPKLRAVPVPAPDAHPAAVYLARLSPGSRPTMRAALDAIAGVLTNGRHSAESLPWPQLRYQHTQAVREKLAEVHSPATVNKMLCALRGVLKECWRLNLMTAEAYQRAADLKAVQGERILRGRALGAGEITALFSACAADRSDAGARDAAILAVLYPAGLRRSEAAQLRREDYDPETGALIVRTGKGNKERIVYLSNGSLDAMNDWIAVRGEDAGPLFWRSRKGGRVMSGAGVTAQAIWRALEKRRIEAGVRPFSPHDLRRTVIGDLLDAGADISIVQQLAGHANVTTTQRYDRRPERAKQKAASLLHVPYVSRRK